MNSLKSFSNETQTDITEEIGYDIQEQSRNHKGSSLWWTGNCQNTSINVHSLQLQ